MTAEVGIINKKGVALGADSATTITKRDGEVRTLNNAQKIFNLGGKSFSFLYDLWQC